MELESRVRGEQLGNWLGSADMRQGALQAILLTPGVPISIEQLSPVFISDDPTSQALALAIASRRKIEVPSGILSKLRQSASAQVRLLAEPSSNSGSSQSLADECHRAFPLKPPPAKFGTVFEVAAATPATKAGTTGP